MCHPTWLEHMWSGRVLTYQNSTTWAICLQKMWWHRQETAIPQRLLLLINLLIFSTKSDMCPLLKTRHITKKKSHKVKSSHLVVTYFFRHIWTPVLKGKTTRIFGGTVPESQWLKSLSETLNSILSKKAPSNNAPLVNKWTAGEQWWTADQMSRLKDFFNSVASFLNLCIWWDLFMVNSTSILSPSNLNPSANNSEWISESL